VRLGFGLPAEELQHALARVGLAFDREGAAA
jgi:hypothetical protein